MRVDSAIAAMAWPGRSPRVRSQPTSRRCSGAAGCATWRTAIRATATNSSRTVECTRIGVSEKWMSKPPNSSTKVVRISAAADAASSARTQTGIFTAGILSLPECGFFDADAAQHQITEQKPGEQTGDDGVRRHGDAGELAGDRQVVGMREPSIGAAHRAARAWRDEDAERPARTEGGDR